MTIEIKPLEQFKIEPLVPFHPFGIDASYTNAALLMTIAVVLVTALTVLATRNAGLVPRRWQSVAEMSYEFVANMVESSAGHGGMAFFPFIFTLFMFVLFGNVLGLVPYGYTFTSQIVVTFALAITVCVGVTIVGFIKHGFHFLALFVPPGVPAVLLLLLVPIEVLSYCIRPFTLAIRLFANMLAGHTMLAIFAGFAASLPLFGILPVGIDVAIYFLEILVAVLQAYVFAILSCLYLHDALHIHH